MRTHLFPLVFQAACLVCSVTLLAQAPAQAPAAPKNLLVNPGFETGIRAENGWYGVDSTGVLAGAKGSLRILATSGGVADTSMPVSVSVADMNGDGLPDIAVMDVQGYLRVYFNSGTKTEPKFTVGETANLFIRDPNRRVGQHIHLCDMSRSGKNDLLVGNYIGEIMLIPNSGSGAKPDFLEPTNRDSVIIPTMKNPENKWGNVFAPAVWDWNKDAKDDLLVGEGSYSANSIHLLLNQGSNGRPVFNEEKHSTLAYGMGLEQLTPCVVDYNGDGFPDLLVAERAGKIAVYLNTGKPWKAGQTLAFDSFIPVGGIPPAAAPGSKDPMEAAKATGLLSLGGITTIAAGDFNGDGLFDLVFGKSNGKIAISFNTGTKTMPKFGMPVDIKADAATPPFSSPSGWGVDYSHARGNFYGFFSVVRDEEDPEAKPTEGKACLKAGYVPSPNKIMPVPTQYRPADKGWKLFNGREIDLWPGAAANVFTLSQVGHGPLKTGKTYVFSMKVKGSKVKEAIAYFHYDGYKKLSEAKIVRTGDRGAASIKKNEVIERNVFPIPFSVGPQWTELKKEFTPKFENKNLADLALTSSWSLAIGFILSPGSQGGVIYFDDMKLIEK